MLVNSTANQLKVPKRKPKLTSTNTPPEPKPAPAPKKFTAFSEHDSRSIEAAYQKLIDESDNPRNETFSSGSDKPPCLSSGMKLNNSLNEGSSDDNLCGKFRVPVQEDYLFDVDVEKREISPVYWLGPVFEARRGSWFYQEGTTLRPCEENMAAQLEEGYLKVKPFRYPKLSESSSKNFKSSSLKTADTPGCYSSHSSYNRTRNENQEITSSGPSEDQKTSKYDIDDKPPASSKDLSSTATHQPQTYRLFGTYMNSVVTYQDACVAWLSADSIISRVSSTVYQRFAGGGYLGGVKLVRGYIDINKAKESLDQKGMPTPSSMNPRFPASSGHLSPQLDQVQQKLSKERSMVSENLDSVDELTHNLAHTAETSLLSDKNTGTEAEAVLNNDQNENQNEFNNRESELQGRQISHLILCTHG